MWEREVAHEEERIGELLQRIPQSNCVLLDGAVLM
jgi:hypothetical protein